MRAIVQRVNSAKVSVEGETIGQIDNGLLVYLGVGKDDCPDDAKIIAEKITNLRVFKDAENKMNLSVIDVSGAVLLISNFTLFGDCRKGRRPGFDAAAEPQLANELYETAAKLIEQKGLKVEKGRFAAYMDVQSSNDGSINFLLDSKKLF